MSFEQHELYKTILRGMVTNENITLSNIISFVSSSKQIRYFASGPEFEQFWMKIIIFR